MLLERTPRPLGNVLRSSQVIRFQDWRDARFGGKAWRAVAVAAVLTAVVGALALIDAALFSLPAAWLLTVVAIGAVLGGWRVGLITAAFGSVALWFILIDRNPSPVGDMAGDIWQVAQFAVIAGGMSLMLGAVDRAIREMRKAARALARGEQRAREVAQKLQRTILPGAPPDIPGLQVAARYLPADPSDVGGDFYDWYQAADDRWYLQIGDVCGKGPAAASRALLARYTLRTAAMLDGDPIRMLQALNTAIMAEADDRYCTAAVLRIHLDGDPAADIALGGHPQALVLRGTAVLPFGRAGSLLGLFAETDLRCDRVKLEPGDRLFLYTDGVTDRPGAPIDDLQLHAMLSSLNHLQVEDFASELERRLLTSPDGRDDIAFVLMALDWQSKN